MRERVFSGIQPTGNLHLGNYLGAIKQWVTSQDDYDTIFCIVNSHAITIKQDPKILTQTTLQLTALLLACGIDIEKSILFVQSEVDEHAGLAWILECHIPMGDMSRMTQFKDKSQKNAKNINVGLFSYPALMAADILLYNVDSVPVGDDQRQHIELTRDVALRFNKEYGDVFTIPKAMIPQMGARIMSLSDPANKMSKSDTNPNGMIAILDSPDVIRKKLRRATTDSLAKIAFNENQKGIYNLLTIYQSITGQDMGTILDELAPLGYAALKDRVADVVIETLAPIQERYHTLIDDVTQLKKILCDGANKARQIAKPRYTLIKEHVGLL